MASTTVGDEVRLEEAARTGWLCYVAGHTQDEMARIPGVSRRSAQRLVGRAASMGPVKVRIDHPIARCVELGHELVERFGLRLAEVCPSTPETPDLLAGVAAAVGAHIERVMQDKTPRIVSLGTGRALGAAVERGVPMERPQHRVVGRAGAMLGDGPAIPFDAAVRLAERTGARCHPMGAPARARDPEEVVSLHALPAVANTLDLASRAEISFVGVGGWGLPRLSLSTASWVRTRWPR